VYRTFSCRYRGINFCVHRSINRVLKKKVRRENLFRQIFVFFKKNNTLQIVIDKKEIRIEKYKCIRDFCCWKNKRIKNQQTKSSIYVLMKIYFRFAIFGDGMRNILKIQMGARLKKLQHPSNSIYGIGIELYRQKFPHCDSILGGNY
jgi:hypothetical protein